MYYQVVKINTYDDLQVIRFNNILNDFEDIEIVDITAVHGSESYCPVMYTLASSAPFEDNIQIKLKRG